MQARDGTEGALQAMGTPSSAQGRAEASARAQFAAFLVGHLLGQGVTPAA